MQFKMLITFVVVTVVVLTDAVPLRSGTYNNFPVTKNEDEYGGYFEGDMVLTRKQKQAISTAITARNGLKDGVKRWPNQTVVYYIKEDDFDSNQVKSIEDGMADISNKSCIKFRKREGDEHAVTIQGSASGCFSGVGLSMPGEEGDEQVLNLAKGCFKHGTVVHEMLHTIGFYHMQSTYDRDDYVQIVWKNIISGLEYNFAKYNNDSVTDFGVPYDYNSVMHYSETAFSKNGNKTIIALKENVIVGQRNGLTESDIIKLNKMYCEDSTLEEKNPSGVSYGF